MIVSPSEPFGFLVSLGCIFLFKNRSLESLLAFLHSFVGLWTCAPHRGMTGQGPGNLSRTCQVLNLWVFSLMGDSFSRHVSSGVLAINMCVGDPLHHVVQGSLHSSNGVGSPSFFLWWGVPFIPHVVGSPSFFMWWGRVLFILYVWEVSSFFIWWWWAVPFILHFHCLCP